MSRAKQRRQVAAAPLPEGTPAEWSPIWDAIKASVGRDLDVCDDADVLVAETESFLRTGVVS